MVFLHLHGKAVCKLPGTFTRHSREHFPTTEHLSDALVHQLEVLSLGSDNVNLMFGPDFFTDAQRSAARLANIMVLLSTDKGVSRMALSKPPQVLNDVARSITQSSGTTEPYSIAGLNGTGIVVGIAE